MAINFPASPTDGQEYDGFIWRASSGVWESAPTTPAGLPAGSIIAWGSSTLPANWLLCDGTAVSRSTYASLFAVIGTTYGAGDGSTTFNVPDLRGRVAVGRDAGQTEFDVLGETGGAKTHTHQHVSPVTVTSGSLRLAGPFDANLDTPGSYDYSSINTISSVNIGVSGGAATERYVVTSSASSSLQPYVVTNYIIKSSAAWTPGDSELAVRVGALETADSTTNKSGLVPVIPSSVVVGSGSGSASSTGVVTFSGASSVSLNGCFTNTFSRYRIVIQATGTLGNALYFRYRNSGTDSSANSYYYSGFWTRPSANPMVWGGNATAFDIGRLSSIRQASIVLECSAVMESTNPQIHASAVSHDGTSQITVQAAGYLEVNAPYDGLTIFPSSNTTTGTIQVYGYRN